MKRLFLAALLTFCFVLHGYSQNFIQGVVDRLSFGVKAGGNYSNYVNTSFSTQALTGFHAGALVDFRLTNHLAFQEEFLFSTQGAKVKGDVFGQENVRVNYLSVPLLFKYRTTLGLYVEAGMQVGVRLNENVGGSGQGNFAKLLDQAAVGGLGYQSKMGLGVGVRYVAGFSKVGDLKDMGVSEDFRTSVAQASIFYIF